MGAMRTIPHGLYVCTRNLMTPKTSWIVFSLAGILLTSYVFGIVSSDNKWRGEAISKISTYT